MLKIKLNLSIKNFKYLMNTHRLLGEASVVPENIFFKVQETTFVCVGVLYINLLIFKTAIEH